MRSTIRSFAFLGSALFVASCGGGTIPDPGGDGTGDPGVELPTAPRLDGVVPSRVSVEGGEVATVYGARFCVRALLRVGGELVALETKSADTLTFRVPAAKDLRAVTAADVAVECPEGTSAKENALTWDPALVVKPAVADYGPLGTVVDVHAPVKVTFNRAMDPASLPGHLGVEGVSGTVTYDQATRTATFTPDGPLSYQRGHVGFVIGGPEGVRSSFGDTLPADLRWLFQTGEASGSPLP